MALLAHINNKIVANQQKSNTIDNKCHSNLNAPQAFFSDKNDEVPKIKRTDSSPGVIEGQSSNGNALTTKSYPLNLSIMMSIPSPKAANLKSIKLVREETAKSRNIPQSKVEFTNYPFIKLSSDYIAENNINHSTNHKTNKIIWRNRLHIEKEPEATQALSTRMGQRKPFANDEMKLKGKKSFNKDMTTNKPSFKDELKNLKYKLSKRTIETTDRTNKALSESKSEIKISIKPESDRLPDMPPHKRDFLLNQDKLNRQKVLLQNLNNNDYIKQLNQKKNELATTKIGDEKRHFNSNSLKSIFQKKENDTETKEDIVVPSLTHRETNPIEKYSHLQTPSGNGASSVFSKQELLFTTRSENKPKENRRKQLAFDPIRKDTVFERETVNSILLLANDNEDNKQQHNAFIVNKVVVVNNRPLKAKIKSIRSLPEINTNECDKPQLTLDVNRIKLACKEDLLLKNDTYLIQNKQFNSLNKKLTHFIRKELKKENKQVTQLETDPKTKEIAKEKDKPEDKPMLFSNRYQRSNMLKFQKTQLIRGNTNSKQSDLKTDTDTKGKHTKYHNVSEFKNEVITLLTEIKPKEKNHNRSCNTITDPKAITNYKKNKHKRISTELSSITSKAEFCKSQLSHRTNSKPLDLFSKEATKNIEELSSKAKTDLLMRRIPSYQIIYCTDSNIYPNTFPSDSIHLIQSQLREANYNPNDVIDMDYSLFDTKVICSTDFAIANYICMHYMVINPIDLSDYLFGIKSDFIKSNVREVNNEMLMRRAQTKKSTIINPDRKIHTGNNLLLVQRFIQHDSVLAEVNTGCGNLFINIDASFTSESDLDLIDIKPRKRCRRSLTYMPMKQLRMQKTLDVLKHKPFFIWRQDGNAQKIFKMIRVPHHLKALIKEINDCFLSNKLNLSRDPQYDIYLAFSSSQLLYALLLQLVKLNARDVIDKCLQLKTDFNLNYQDSKGNTLLIAAIKASFDGITETLLRKGADPNIQNVFGNTALHYAVSHKNFPCIDLLTQYGGREDILNNQKLPAWEVINFNLEDDE